MHEKVILENEKYKVIYKRSPFEEGDLERYEYDGPDIEIGDRFNLPDLITDLLSATKRYALWNCWLDGLASIFSRRSKEELEKFKTIINRPGPFEPGGALYKEKD